MATVEKISEIRTQIDEIRSLLDKRSSEFASTSNNGTGSTNLLDIINNLLKTQLAFITEVGAVLRKVHRNATCESSNQINQLFLNCQEAIKALNDCDDCDKNTVKSFAIELAGLCKEFRLSSR